MSDAHRLKIQKSAILTALIKHAEGKLDMSPTQVSAGLGLLKKCLPDLSTVNVQGDEDGGPVQVVHKIERTIVKSSDRDG